MLAWLAGLALLLLFANLAEAGIAILEPTDAVTVAAEAPPNYGGTPGDVVVRERSSNDATGSEAKLHISAFFNFDLAGVTDFHASEGDKAIAVLDFQGRLNTVNPLPLYVGQITGGAWNSSSSLPQYNWATKSPAPAGPGSQTAEAVIVADVVNDAFGPYAADVAPMVENWVNGAQPNYGAGVYLGNHNQGAGFGNFQLQVFSNILIYDDFDNADIASGGPNAVNGGFKLVTNGAGGAGSVSESGTQATLSATGGGNDNSGIVSVNTFDPTADPTHGFSVTWVVDSAQNPEANGINLMVQSGDGFINDPTGRPNFRFQFDRNNDGAFHLVADNGGGAFNLLTDPVTLGEVLDGFTLTATLNEAGWSFTSTGIPSLADAAGAWTTTHNYSTLFDNSTFVGAFIQTGGSGNRTMVIDRIAVTANVPEPGGWVMVLGVGLGLGMLAGKRRGRRRRVGG